MTAELARAEQLYLTELMATRDAVEGLDAFLSKGPLDGAASDMMVAASSRIVDTRPPGHAKSPRAAKICSATSISAPPAVEGAKPGRKVIGYMPFYAPRELIHAAGALPLGILGGGDQLEVIRGDAYYQSYICRIPRSTVELGVSRRLDFVDGMLFPSICDVIRNLSGMWKLMFPAIPARYVDLPQNFDDDVGGEFYRSASKSCVIGLRRLPAAR